MKCMHCMGEMKWSTAPFHVDRNGCHVLLDAVPAWVCVQCGEAYFEGREVDFIQDVVNSIEEKKAKFALADKITFSPGNQASFYSILFYHLIFSSY